MIVIACLTIQFESVEEKHNNAILSNSIIEKLNKKSVAELLNN